MCKFRDLFLLAIFLIFASCVDEEEAIYDTQSFQIQHPDDARWCGDEGQRVCFAHEASAVCDDGCRKSASDANKCTCSGAANTNSGNSSPSNPVWCGGEGERICYTHESTSVCESGCQRSASNSNLCECGGNSPTAASATTPAWCGSEGQRTCYPHESSSLCTSGCGRSTNNPKICSCESDGQTTASPVTPGWCGSEGQRKCYPHESSSVCETGCGTSSRDPKKCACNGGQITTGNSNSTTTTSPLVTPAWCGSEGQRTCYPHESSLACETGCSKSTTDLKKCTCGPESGGHPSAGQPNVSTPQTPAWCGRPGQRACYAHELANSANSTPSNGPVTSRRIAPWTPTNRTCAWPNGGAQAAVSFTYDDSLQTQFQVGAPLLESKGMRGTFFIMDSTFNSNFTQLGQRGHDLGGHSADCSTNAHVVTDAVALLRQSGGWSGNKTFAYPCGNRGTRPWLSGQGFIGARGTSAFVNRQGFDRWNAGSFSIHDNSNHQAAIRHYQNAVSQNGWASYHFHNIDGRERQLHDDIVNRVAGTAGIWVAPFSEVMRCAITAGFAQ